MGSVFPRRGWAAAFNRSSSFAICDAFEWLVVKLVGINYHTVWNPDRKLRSESYTASETQKVFFGCNFVPGLLYYFTLWSWASLHHDYSCSTTNCAVWSRVPFIHSRPSGTRGFISPALISSSHSCDWDIYIRVEGVHPVIDIFTQGESVH